MDEKAKLYDQVVSNLRACLVSAQGGIPITSISRDYKQLLGESIPYKRLGFTTLEGLLSELPGIKIKTRGAESFVEIEAAPTSEHISKLVEKQRRSDRGKRRPGTNGHLHALRKPPSSLRASGKLIKPQQRPNGNSPSSSQPANSNRPNRATNVPKKKPQALMGVKLAPLDVGQNSGDREPGPMSPVTPPTPTTATSGGGARQKTPGSGRIRHNVYPEQQQQPLTVSPPPSQNPHIISPTHPAEFLYRNPAQQRLLQMSSNSSSSDAGSDCFQQSAASPTEHHRQSNNAYHHKPHPSHQVPHHPPHNHARPHPPKHSNHQTESHTKLCVIPQGPEPYLPGCFIDRLVQMMDKHRCPPPTFILLPRRPKGSDSPLYSCRVVITFPETPTTSAKEHDFSTFPQEFKDLNLAKENVAETAYTELFVNRRPKNFTLSTTTNENLILTRVTEIVAGRTQGVWTDHIETHYETRFDEKLPNNWVSLIRNCPHLMAEKLTESSIIIRAVQSNRSLNGNVTSNAVNEYLTPPPPLVPPSSDHWDVYITRTINSTKIWLRFIGDEYSVMFENLATEMEAFYNHRSWDRVNRPSLERDRYYAMVGPDACARVRLVDFVANTNSATVSFVDHGDVDLVTLSGLRPLANQFARLPAQAIECSLHGLEGYEESPIMSQLLAEHIEGKVLVAEVVSVSPIKLILHDTSGDNPVNLNSLFAEIMELVESKLALMVSKSVYEAFLTHVSNNGDIYLQFPSKAITYINHYLDEITPEIYEKCRITDRSLLQQQKIYLAKSKLNGHYVRVRIYGQIQDQVEVEMIDYGRVMTTPYNTLLESEEIAGILNVIPPQCVRVHLKDIPPAAFQKRAVVLAFGELVKTDERVLVKVDSVKGSALDSLSSNLCSATNLDNETPIVELFKRIQPQNLLISVNFTLKVNNADLFDEQDDLVKSFQKTEIKHELKQADTAKINEKYFEVYVVSAANPFNFVVQPARYRIEFKNMLIEMGKYYSANDLNCVFTDIEIGAYCVCYIERLNGWYRGFIDKIVSSEDVSFYACDIGELCIINNGSLRVLEQQFMELPALAFNAKLTRIRPLDCDWLVGDTQRFQQLTENKTFSSVIENITPGNNQHRVTLGLRLINAKTETDIAHTFVCESRAIYN